MSNRQARTIRLPEELWTELEAEAESQKRSVNNLVEVMLERSLQLDPLMESMAREAGADR